MTLCSDQELTDDQISKEVEKYLTAGDRVVILSIKDL